LIILDASALNVGLPAINHDFGGSLSGLQWVVDSYVLTFAALLLSAGTLSDRIGANRAFAWGLAIFSAASVACGVAPNLTTLIIARIAQGGAAALMLPASLAQVRHAYEHAAQRARAISIWTAGGASAVAAGPVAGGLLVSAWSWRGIFLINLPVGILGLVLLARTRFRAPRQAAALDVIGQVTAVVTLAATTYAVIEGGHGGYRTPRVGVAIMIAIVAAATFIFAEAKVREPMIPLNLFRSRAVSISLISGFVLNAGFYGTFFVLSLYVQQIRGFSPFQAGLLFVPVSLVITVVNLTWPSLARRFGPRVSIVAGQATMMLGLFGLIAIDSTTSAFVLAALLIPVGLGGALAVPTLTSILLNGVSADRAGLAAGVFNAVRQVGAGIAVAVFGSLVAGSESFLSGMTASALTAIVLLLGAATATLMVTLPTADH
jgi:DHA2 family methylenomycin A resistance protein-like MFS transporter